MGFCLTQEQVERYIAGNCSERELQEIESHLTECEDCKQQIEFIRSNIVTPNQSDSTIATNNNITHISDKEALINQNQQPTINQDEYVTRSIPEGEAPSSLHTKPPSTTASESTFEGYEILDELPAGGQAVVYKAVQKATKRVVALKVLLQGPQASARAQYRFEREVDLAASLRHPNIVTIYDSGITQGQYYFAMEYIDGKPLDKYVESEKLSLRQTMEVFNKLCAAVAYAHQHGVMHRDLKPHNILVDADGEPHILDFGLAKLTDGSEQTSPDMVMTSIPGKVIGTLAFMSPEQASGQPEAVDVRTDVYSIGMILYKILTGYFPYDISGSMLAILRNIQEVEPTRPSKLIRRFNSDVEAILLKALTKELNYRYQSAAHLQHDIECWLKGLPITARSDSTIYLLRKIITRHYYASAVVGLLIIIILGFSWFNYQLYSRLRKTNKTLRSSVQSLNQEVARYSGLSLNILLAKFLQAWHADELGQSQFIERAFRKGTREYWVASFLSNPSPLTEKIDKARQNLGKREPCFVEFTIAEHYLKNGNRAEAIKAYRRSLSYSDSLEKDPWLATRIKSRLYELTNENQ